MGLLRVSRDREMSGAKDLRHVVAELGHCDPSELTSDYVLDKSPALRGSMGKAVLVAAIRRHLGKDCLEAASAKTYGELEAILAWGQSAKAPGAPPAPETAAPASPEQGPIFCGTDIESVDRFPAAADYRTDAFYQESFAPGEIEYCRAQPEPRIHFAGRWCAKEALKKCDKLLRVERLSDIEVVRAESGEVFFLHRSGGKSRRLPHSLSIAHTDSTAAAFVVKAETRRQLLPLVLSLVALALAAASLLLR